MKKQNDWTEIDERFDKRFGTFYISYAVKSFGEKDVKKFLHSELEKVRQETIKECIEALPKKEIEVPQEMLERMGLTQGRYAIEAYNHAIDQATQNINNLDKGK